MCGRSLSSCAHTTRRDAHTVRYRMTQLRELYGDRLNDPQTILELTLALGIPQHRAAVPARPEGEVSEVYRDSAYAHGATLDEQAPRATTCAPRCPRCLRRRRPRRAGPNRR